MPKFKNNLQYIRKKHKYSQEYVSNKTGIERSILSRYENGERKISGVNLIKLAKLFNVSPETILNEKDTSIITAIKSKNDLKKEIMAFYEADDISEEDKEEIFRALQEFYFREKLKKEK